MITYKTVLFHCGSKYIWVPDITLKPPKCPECGALQKEITYWCLECRTKETVIPLSGQKLRCYECSKYKTNEENKVAKQKKREEVPLLSTEGIREYQKKLIEVWFQDCRDLRNW